MSPSVWHQAAKVHVEREQVAIEQGTLSEDRPSPVETEVEWIVKTLLDGIKAKGRAS